MHQPWTTKHTIVFKGPLPTTDKIIIVLSRESGDFVHQIVSGLTMNSKLNCTCSHAYINFYY